MPIRSKNRSSTNDFLSQLVLWRHDPEQAQEITQLALEGNRDAQYAMGLIYAEGRGVEQDEVEAYFWLTRAMTKGDQDAELLRQIVQQNMSYDQIALAERRVSEQSVD